MVIQPTPDHVALLLTQGRAWLTRTAACEHWPDDRRAAALATLQACPPELLPDHVERLRLAMLDAMQATGTLPHHQRTRRAPPADTHPRFDPDRPRQTGPRGLARYLTHREGTDHDDNA